MRRTFLKAIAFGIASALCTLPGWSQAAPVELEFYYPVAVGGPITKIVDGMVDEFEQSHPDIKIKSIYAGTYQDSVAKALTAYKGGHAPQLAVLLSTDMFTLIDEGAIMPFDPLTKTDDDRKWLDGFYKAFMANSQTGGKTWGIPFQRSTIVMYYNKDLFKEAGLDPDKAPGTWDELVQMAGKLTKRDASGNVTQWGLEIPSSSFAYWLFQALTTPNDAMLMNQDGNEVYLDKPAVIEALQFWHDLAYKHKIMPTGTIGWGTTPKDFLVGKTAIMWTTTGNLTNVRKNAKFDFGVAPMPKAKRGGSPTGGGNFYLFKSATPAQQEAAYTFVKWMTSPENAAAWSIATGYVATSPAAWETDKMKAYVKEVPQAVVARDQLAVSVAEFSTHDNQRVTKLLDDNIQAVLTNAKTPAEAMKAAQSGADRLLRGYK
ncbi:ABC transporter substrate-binding protein [Allopusillimonas soli]|uniref:ABC transporter substrate-binding protein n=1 Tax=Allopusillimonas soli TaxID=659016 RepID=A0A853FAZ7_9BURK|nr:ABC transporter substrate-binding protein [Allopusillimonas soli]NYT37915.1 ABC transporter substrate-binding protein [Allopusillimonas soli]TEA73814.1 ABC transporter substrate-binding protein [Allopusillimonas soli]